MSQPCRFQSFLEVTKRSLLLHVRVSGGGGHSSRRTSEFQTLRGLLRPFDDRLTVYRVDDSGYLDGRPCKYRRPREDGRFRTSSRRGSTLD